MFTVAVVGVVLAYTWLVAPIAPRWMASAAGVIVLALAIARALKTGDWGLRARAFLPALWRAAAFTAAGALVLYIAGTQLGTWHDRHTTAGEFVLLFAWGFGQQLVLQTVILREVRVRLKPDATHRPDTAVGLSADTTYACAAAALIFAALHLPNPFLAAVTFAGALIWCWIYSRFPNILPLALSHALLTVVILSAFDDRITGRLRVGAAYLAR